MSKSKREIPEEMTEGTTAEIQSKDEAVDDATPNIRETTEIDKTNKEIRYIYIGPTLPKNELKNNSILTGSIDNIKKHYKNLLEKYPQVIKLIIPTEKLAEYKTKILVKGNVINKYFDDILIAIRTAKEE